MFHSARFFLFEVSFLETEYPIVKNKNFDRDNTVALSDMNEVSCSGSILLASFFVSLSHSEQNGLSGVWFSLACLVEQVLLCGQILSGMFMISCEGFVVCAYYSKRGTENFPLLKFKLGWKVVGQSRGV